MTGMDIGGQLIARRESDKRRQNQPLCREMHWYCVPFVTTTMGQWGPAAKRFMEREIKIRALQGDYQFVEQPAASLNAAGQQQERERAAPDTLCAQQAGAAPTTGVVPSGDEQIANASSQSCRVKVRRGGPSGRLSRWG